MFLEKEIQATAVSYKKKAILIMGKAGVGKTTLALNLIEKGATLIGDDFVKIFIKNNKLYCKHNEKLKGIIEIRELGLVSGFKVAKASPVLCVIQLHKKTTERLPEQKSISLLDKKVPLFDFCACKISEIKVLYAVRTLLGKMTLLKE